MTAKKDLVFRLFALSLFCCSALAVAGDARSLFNHGAELATAEQFDEAVDVLRQAAVVRDRRVAAKALSLLGQLAVASAKQNISENPTETLPEQRQTIFEHLKSAEQAFAESLSLLPDEKVQQYLETLRAWRNNMTNAWEEYDREQQRNAELPQRIHWLADWEEKLSEKTRQMLEEPDSPRKFQTNYESSREQKQLAEELTLLQDVPMDDEGLKEEWNRLPEIQKMADEAAELLTNHRAEEAMQKQQQVLDYLRSLLKQNQNQDQDQQNQDQQNQEQQEQQSQSNDDPSTNEDNGDDGDKGEQNSKMNESDGLPPAEIQKESTQGEESSEERAERFLMQVRRKEQAAKELREQLRTLLMQTEPVEKDW